MIQIQESGENLPEKKLLFISNVNEYCIYIYIFDSGVLQEKCTFGHTHPAGKLNTWIVWARPLLPTGVLGILVHTTFTHLATLAFLL